ncbi:MAG: molybdopterin molybdotransferase MoeA [Marmoricola sp.]|nr:molybdopterin molybdotransferase MoeA [Marmoricola sp.]
MTSEPNGRAIPVEEYLQRILARVEPMEPFEHSLMDALGLPVAEDVHASVSLPVFDNSGMDGYAVAFRDVADATEDRPLHLPVVGEIAAGQATIFDLTPGTAVRIMTGAPVPSGCSAVVPFEWTSEEGPEQRREVVVRRAPEEGQHIRRAGEEIAKGDLLMRAGEVIGPRQLGLLAAAGLGRVRTAPRPRVVVMSTGSELVEPGRELGRDSIYDANSYLLAAAVRAHGGVAYRVTATTDDPHDFTEALSDQLVRADLVVTSGGVSKGTHDVVKEVLAGLGTVDFLEVAMQPGKPQGFGFVGEDSTPIFTLPGNPVSAYVSFEMFVVPALHRLTGRDGGARRLTTARVTEPVRSMRGRSQLLRARVDMDADGLRATPVGGPGSHLIAGLAGSDALLVLAEDVTRVDAGEQVPVLLLDVPA